MAQRKKAAGKRRPGAAHLDKLASRVGTGKVAKRLGITERTLGTWLRVGPPATRKDDVETFYARHERSRKAAEIREEQRARIEREVKAEKPPKGFEVVTEPTQFTRKQDNAFRRARLHAAMAEMRREIESIDDEEGDGKVEEIGISPEEKARRRLLRVFHSREDLDQTIREVAEEGDFSARELYTMFFSPEVAA